MAMWLVFLQRNVSGGICDLVDTDHVVKDSAQGMMGQLNGGKLGPKWLCGAELPTNLDDLPQDSYGREINFY